MRTEQRIPLVCPWCVETEDGVLHLSITHYRPAGGPSARTAIAVARPDRSRVIWAHDCPGPKEGR